MEEQPNGDVVHTFQPGVCSVDSGAEETDGRAAGSSRAMFRRNIQYRGLATVLTDVICLDDGFGFSDSRLSYDIHVIP
jgi:hypothetical protein